MKASLNKQFIIKNVRRAIWHLPVIADCSVSHIRFVMDEETLGQSFLPLLLISMPASFH